MSDEYLHDNEQLRAVLQQISAQLKYSLGNIYSALERIAPAQARDEDEKLDQNAAVLCQSYYRVLRLANNLDDAVNLESPSRVKLTNDDIAGLCRRVADEARACAELLGLELEFVCEKQTHIISMNADRLERLLLNLLSNAFKFTPRGGKITLEIKIGRQNVELIVTDTGRGIAPQRLEHIFDRYLMTDTLDSLPYGLGLGLPICRRIAREHGGGILLTSEEGKGTTVAVSLPNKRSSIQELSTYVIDYAGGFNRTLVELSDALPRQAFTQRFLD